MSGLTSQENVYLQQALRAVYEAPAPGDTANYLSESILTKIRTGQLGTIVVADTFNFQDFPPTHVLDMGTF